MKSMRLPISLLVAAFALAACGKSNGGGSGGGGNDQVNPALFPGQVNNLPSAPDVYDNSEGYPQSTILGQPLFNRSFFLGDRDTGLSNTRLGEVNDLVLVFDANGMLSAAAKVDLRVFEQPANADRNNGNRYSNNGDMNAFINAGNNQNGVQVNGQINGQVNGQFNPQLNQQGRLGGVVIFQAKNIPYEFRPNSGKIYIDAFTLSSSIATNPYGNNGSFGNMSSGFGANVNQPMIQQSSVNGKLGIRVSVVRKSLTKILGMKLRTTRYSSVIEGRLLTEPNVHTTVADSRSTGVSSNPNNYAFDIDSELDSGDSRLRMNIGDIIPQGTMSRYTMSPYVNAGYNYGINYGVNNGVNGGVNNGQQQQFNQNQQPIINAPGQSQSGSTIVVYGFAKRSGKWNNDYFAPILTQMGYVRN
jgi:hypothetical protein